MPEVPRITSGDVAQLTAREFPRQADHVWQLLERYGPDDWHGEVHRVRAAVLHLARGDLDRLAQLVEAACTDYRDVLVAAEYPNYDDGPEARSEDAHRYRAWLYG